MAATMQCCGLLSTSSHMISSSPSSSGSISKSSAIACSHALGLNNDFYGKNPGLSCFTTRTNGWRHRQISFHEIAEGGNGATTVSATMFFAAKMTYQCHSRNPTMIASARAAEQAKTSDGKPVQTIAITGATGFVGTKLVQRLVAEGHKVRVLTRSASKARSVFPDKDFPDIEIAEQPDWATCVQGTTGIVNLAGTPIGGRWTEKIKQDIKASRVAVTTKVVEAINAAPKELRPSVFISGTAVGFYGSTSESSAFDESSPSGKDYLAEVCRDWEAKAQDLDSSIRLVRLRIGIVLDKNGGALAQMVPLFQIFAGGPLGSGRQWFSWVHRDDLVSLIVEALSNPAYEGAINGTAPNPVRFTELCDRIGAALGRPSWLPVPEFALKAILGEGAFVVLEGQRVLPKKAQALGFRFKYQYVTDALKAILA